MATRYFSSCSKVVIVVLLFICTFNSNEVSSQTLATTEHSHNYVPTSTTEAIAKHDNLETELEFYPFNIVVPSDPVFKNEAMFDYHKFSSTEKSVYGVRFFADANTHWAKTRDMKDLIMYTEFYYGLKHFQLGMETGSVTGEEYVSIGPQYVTYDSKAFRRLSLVSRVFPDFVLGYEFTTQEFNLFDHVNISSTGMGRMVFPSYQRVVQASVWLSFEKIKGMYFGVEYEYNSASSYNNFRFETNNELFFGIKAEIH
jgi:hypothetical protein